MNRALAMHDALMRATVAACGGYEVGRGQHEMKPEPIMLPAALWRPLPWVILV